MGGVLAVGFAAVALSLSVPTSHESGWFAIPVRVAGLLGIGVGCYVWVATPKPTLGRLTVLAGATYYVQDLRAARAAWVFAAGFCLAYMWTAVVAHVLLSWPSGRLPGIPERVLVAASYLLAVGSQIVRYLVDRPDPPWWYGIDTPVTAATRASSVLEAAMAIVIAGWLVVRWAQAHPVDRSVTWPVWGTTVLVAVLSAAAGLAAAVGAPNDVQNATVAIAVGAGALVLPTSWIYATMNQQLREIVTANRRVAEAETATRQRVQHTLHNTVQVPLWTAATRLASVGRLDHIDHAELAAQLAQVAAHLDQVRDAIRRAVDGLYPRILHSEGLRDVVENLIDPFRPDYRFSLDITGERLGEFLEICLYEIISEAVANCVKHAGCDRIEIALAVSDREVRLDVADNGRVPIPAGVTPWFIAARVTSAGGRLQISSASGTRLVVRIPRGTP